MTGGFEDGGSVVGRGGFAVGAGDADYEHLGGGVGVPSRGQFG